MTATKQQHDIGMMFCAEGYMPSGAASIVGNLSQESGNELPSAFRTGKLDHGSQGLPQWRTDRLEAYMAYVKQQVDADGKMSQQDLWTAYGRVDLQVAYIIVELKRDYATLDAALRKGGDISTLTADVCWQYERPSKAAANLANRVAQAEATFASLKAPSPSATAAADATTKPAAGATGEAMGTTASSIVSKAETDAVNLGQGMSNFVENILSNLKTTAATVVAGKTTTTTGETLPSVTTTGTNDISLIEGAVSEIEKVVSDFKAGSIPTAIEDIVSFVTTVMAILTKFNIAIPGLSSFMTMLKMVEAFV